MRTISQTDEFGIFTGETLEIDDFGGRPLGWVEAPAPAKPSIWDGEGWRVLKKGEADAIRAPVAPPLPVPASVSDRQFAQQLALDGRISEDEALAWAARGDIPAAMLAALESDAFPAEQRFNAKMLLSAATVYERNHPLAPILGGLLGYDSPESLDNLWRSAGALG